MKIQNAESKEGTFMTMKDRMMEVNFFATQVLFTMQLDDSLILSGLIMNLITCATHT